MSSFQRAKQGAAAFSVILLAALLPLACGPDAPDPGEDPNADAGELLVDAGGSEDAAGEFPDAALPGADAGTPGSDAGLPGPDASQSGPDASRPPGRDAGPNGTGELADCPPYPSTTEPDDYSDLDGLFNSTLKNALFDRVKGHTSLSYENARGRLFSANGGVDLRRDGQIECIYTGELFAPSQLNRTGGFNTEHSWPQSEFKNEATAAKGDMHHLFPTEMNANSRRGNWEFGNTDCSVSLCPWAQGGSEFGPSIVSGKTVFEVRSVYRGDIARAHFYFAVRYRDSIGVEEEDTLRRWHHCDPPDDIELARNDAIEAIQGNRNPFVDRPEFVDFIADF